MAAQQKYIDLAKTLHPRLIRLFARYPSPALLQGLPTAPPSSAQKTPQPVQVAPTTSSSDPNATSQDIIPDQSIYPNPFRSQKDPRTGRWHDPVFSLRRQADLVKLARAHGVEELLPYTVKGTEAKLKKREEHGLRVKGTGVGQKVKGKHWERTMKGRLEARRQAMLEMPRMVQTWKERGHGRGWTKWPKGKAK
ncbi:MAG: hypothetical protein M1817_003586 [Caeruleum heppii]|nr:MAG: hypothetical protein M1817_003586 [Caeruleum heppii]